MTAVIGVDVGTTGVKAIAISTDGEMIAKAEQAYPLSTPRPGWSEQDPEDWWRAVQAALQALAAAGIADVRGIGLSGQMHGLVCLDERATGCSGPRCSGTTSERAPSAPRSKRESASSA